jgi:ABC-type dipeptide/oligopeptide/nickel transport system permease subunit
MAPAESGRELDQRARVGAIVLAVLGLLALLAPLLSPAANSHDIVMTRFLAPLARDLHGAFHLLGTDRLGRDVWSRLLYGARVSLTVGVLTMALSLLLGVAVGAGAAMAPRGIAYLLLGATDFALGVPRVVLLLLLAALWQPSAVQVVLVLGITGWMPIARLVYTETRVQLGRPYVEGATALGAARVRVLLRHILPHAAPPVLAAVTLGIGNAITLEAGLSFLGLGVQPPTASWGSLIASGRDTVVNAPWVGLAPGIALVLVVVSCTLIADGLQEQR